VLVRSAGRERAGRAGWGVGGGGVRTPEATGARVARAPGASWSPPQKGPEGPVKSISCSDVPHRVEVTGPVNCAA